MGAAAVPVEPDELPDAPLEPPEPLELAEAPELLPEAAPELEPLEPLAGPFPSPTGVIERKQPGAPIAAAKEARTIDLSK